MWQQYSLLKIFGILAVRWSLTREATLKRPLCGIFVQILERLSEVLVGHGQAQ